MNIIKDEKKISRNAKIGFWAQITGLLLLSIGIYITFSSQGIMIGVALIVFSIGLLISQIGVYLTNRWGRRPRPDEMIDKALKGLDKRYTLFHYSSPIAHLLIGPAGVWALLPRNIKGSVRYNPARNRWQHRGGGLLYKLFSQDALGRPELDAAAEIGRVHRFLSQNLPEERMPGVKAVLAFTSEDITIFNEGSPIPALPATKLKNYIREQAKLNQLSSTSIEQINEVIKMRK